MGTVMDADVKKDATARDLVHVRQKAFLYTEMPSATSPHKHQHSKKCFSNCRSCRLAEEFQF